MYIDCFLICPVKLSLKYHYYKNTVITDPKDLNSPPMPHMSFTDFVVFPPGHGRSVTDFWGWDAHEARLPCPDDVSGDIGGCSARRALKPNFY